MKHDLTSKYILNRYVYRNEIKMVMNMLQKILLLGVLGVSLTGCIVAPYDDGYDRGGYGHRHDSDRRWDQRRDDKRGDDRRWDKRQGNQNNQDDRRNRPD